MGRSLEERLSVTIVGAEYPVNVGHAARLMKNFGLKRLYLVDPSFDMRAASVYATHGSDVLSDAKVVSLAKVRKTHDFLLATTAMRAKRRANVARMTVRPEEAVEKILKAKSASIVFGRDTTGLTNKEISVCDLTTTVDTGTEYRTLNLSHSMAILLYLTYRAGLRGTRPAESQASRDRREAFSRYAQSLALALGVQPHKAERIVQVARRIAAKSDTNSGELGLLIALMRRAEWALED